MHVCTQVRLQGDLAKPPEKQLGYKNAIDGLIRVRSPPVMLHRNSEALLSAV